MSTITRQPRKQRKRLYNLTLHQKAKLLTAPLSKELRVTLKKRAARVRKGDKVKITRGHFKKHSGAVVRVSVADWRIYVEGAFTKNQKGKEHMVPLYAHDVIITELAKRDAKQAKS